MVILCAMCHDVHVLWLLTVLQRQVYGVCSGVRGGVGGGPTTSRPGVFLETCLLPSALVRNTLFFFFALYH